MSKSLALTVFAPAAVLLLARIPLPGVNPEPLGGAPNSYPDVFGLFALGLSPILSAFGLVELAALIVPRWRPLRVGGYDGRQRLWSRTKLLGFVLAAVQGYFLVTWMQRAQASLLSADEIVGEGPAVRLYLVAAFATGTLLLAWLAGFIGRHGIGNGFSVLIVALALPRFGRFVVGAWRDLVAGAISPFPLLLVGMAAFVLVWIVRKPRAAAEGSSDPPLRLVVPASGLVPLTVAAGLLMLPISLGNFGVNLWGLAERLVPGTWLYFSLELVLVATLGLLFCWLFNRPQAVEQLWRRDSSAAASDPRSALWRATFQTLLFLALLLAAAWQAARLGLVLEVTAIAVLATVTIDLVGEFQFQKANGTLVAVWPVHRLYGVDPALRALRRNGIPAFPRGLRHRSLWHFFAPFVPVEILVPEAQGSQADATLRELLDGSRPVSHPAPESPE